MDDLVAPSLRPSGKGGKSQKCISRQRSGIPGMVFALDVRVMRESERIDHTALFTPFIRKLLSLAGPLNEKETIQIIPP